MAEKLVLTNSDEATSAIFGAFDANVRMIERAFDVRISNRNSDREIGDAIVVTGERDAVELAACHRELLGDLRDGEARDGVEHMVGIVGAGTEQRYLGIAALQRGLHDL